MFDELQIMSREDIVEPEYLLSLKNEAKKTNNYYELTRQLRMKCNDDTKKWIDNFTINGLINEFAVDDDYQIIPFDSPEKLRAKIKDLSSKKETSLSRLVATYDYPFANNPPKNSTYWNVKIGDWEMPWNNQLDQVKRDKKKCWSEK